MKSPRGTGFKGIKKEGMILELAAEYISREAGRNTLITPTRAHVSSDGKYATIYVSVFPTDQGPQAVKFLLRHKDLFRSYLKNRTRFPVLPYIIFDIDYGEINRQRLDELSREAGIPANVDGIEVDDVEVTNIEISSKNNMGAPGKLPKADERT